MCRLVHVHGAREQYGEFVAAKAGDGIGFAYTAVQPFGDCL